MTPEGKIQKKIIDFLERKGYQCVKIISCSKPGWPDVEAIHKTKPVLYIEVKTETGLVSKLQEFRHRELRELNKIVIVPYGYEDFINQYEKL